jgi:hypothetical protein
MVATFVIVCAVGYAVVLGFVGFIFYQIGKYLEDDSESD